MRELSPELVRWHIHHDSWGGGNGIVSQGHGYLHALFLLRSFGVAGHGSLDAILMREISALRIRGKQRSFERSRLFTTTLHAIQRSIRPDTLMDSDEVCVSGPRHRDLPRIGTPTDRAGLQTEAGTGASCCFSSWITKVLTWTASLHWWERRLPFDHKTS